MSTQDLVQETSGEDSNPFTNRWSKLKRSTKIIVISALVGLLVLIALTILLISFRSRRISCEPSEHRPDHDKFVYVKSNDNRALVGLTGYIWYNLANAAQKVFAPLHLQGVETREINYGTLLALSAGCANIEVSVIVEPKYDQVTGVHFDLELNGQAGNICYLQYFDIQFSPKNHYACKRSMTYPCENNGQLVANITFNQFEFEVDGDPEAVKEYKFSTTPVYC